MVVYQSLGVIIGFFIAYIASKIDKNILKILLVIILFVLFGIIACNILNEMMVMSATAQYQIEEEAYGATLPFDQFVHSKIIKWNTSVYTGEFVGIILGYFFFRKKKKNNENKAHETESEYQPDSNIFFGIVLDKVAIFGAFALAAVVYGVWKQYDNEMGGGFLSAFLRGAVVFGFLSWVLLVLKKARNKKQAHVKIDDESSLPRSNPTEQPQITVDEDRIYAEIAEEFESGIVDKGLWTRLFAECGGDERQTKVLYIKQRADRLITAERSRSQAEADARKAIEAEDARCRVEALTERWKAEAQTRQAEVTRGGWQDQQEERVRRKKSELMQATEDETSKITSVIQPTIKQENNKGVEVFGFLISFISFFIIIVLTIILILNIMGLIGTERSSTSLPSIPYTTNNPTDAKTQFDLGLAYYKGQTVPQDYVEAFKWFSKSANQGYALAQNNLADLYFDGKGVKQDYVEAVKWFQKAADQGQSSAQVSIGWVYMNGLGGLQVDYQQATYWNKLGAQQGHQEGYNNLAWLYENGLGVEKNYQIAANLYQEAAKQGNQEAAKRLDNLISSKKVSVEELSENRQADWSSDKSESGNSGPTDAQTQYNRGLAYYKGEGVSKNFMEAARWFRLSADQGNAEAQFYLGLLYSNGWGMARDYTEAVKWFSISAGQGNAYAQYNLGVIYANGQGVTQNHIEATKWFRMAANQGMKEAQTQLGLAYAKGENSPSVKNDMHSLKDVRNSMNTKDRRIFDIALVLLQDFKSQEGENAFVNTIQGKTPSEVIDLARKEFENKVSIGDPKFKQYSSWEDMLSKKTAERHH